MEVIAATALVMVTCLAVTTVVVAAGRAGARAEGVGAADEALRAEAARLRALPFFAPLPAAWPATRVATAPSAVGELFPHADTAYNGESPGYVASGDHAGAFLSSSLIGEISVRRTAWMARCGDDGWSRVDTGTVAGWTAWSSAAMPAEALVVVLEAGAPKSGGPAPPPTRALVLVLAAEGRPAGADPAALAAAEEGTAP